MGNRVYNLCSCGRKKDYRAEKCAVCAGCGYPVEQDKDAREKELIEAIQTSKSFLEASKKTKSSRGYLATLAKNLSIDISHMSPGRNRPLPDEEIFCNPSKVTSNTLKIRLLSLFPERNRCEHCGLLPLWNGKKLSIQLHHRDGNKYNNLIENLEFLCPNCHSQTETYTGNKSRKRKEKRT